MAANSAHVFGDTGRPMRARAISPAASMSMPSTRVPVAAALHILRSSSSPSHGLMNGIPQPPSAAMAAFRFVQFIRRAVADTAGNARFAAAGYDGPRVFRLGKGPAHIKGGSPYGSGQLFERRNLNPSTSVSVTGFLTS